MRHLFGVVLAMVMGAALFLAAGWGVAEIASLHARGAMLTATPGLAAIGAVLGAGLLLGILLAVPAISPVAAGLPGIALLAWSALFLVSTKRATRLIPLQGHSSAAGFASLLTTGVLAFVGAVMIVPLFVPSRWRPRPAEYDYADEPSDIGLLR
jgi:phage tail protein X